MYIIYFIYRIIIYTIKIKIIEINKYIILNIWNINKYIIFLNY